jgi:fluoroacetyl-CoA thioesterase
LKPGLTIGHRATIKATVTPKMFAQFEGKVVHPAYSTVAMVYHMEWAARQIILPFLEANEEGMGGAVTVKHLGVSVEGEVIKATATLSEIKGRRLVAQVTVENSQGIVGQGEVTQFILGKEELQEKMK